MWRGTIGGARRWRVVGTVAVVAASLSVCRAEDPKIVIPFDFESRFDSGDYGARVGEMIWKKLDTDGGVVIPESMLDVRDVCERLKFHPGPETPLDEIGKVIRRDFDAHIAIWGSVERVPPNTTDVYDLTLKVVDFSGDVPVVLLDEQHRTKTVSEIPHLYVRNMLARLTGHDPTAVTATADPAAEQRWRDGPNLVLNGTFQAGAKSPDGWDPLPAHVSLQPDGTDRIVRMTFGEDVAGTTGVLYYSEFFPVDEGATYRVSCRYRTSGSAGKVFIKCYDDFAGRTGAQQTPDQRREVYRSQQNLKGAAAEWHTHVEDFTPRHPKFTPRYARVMLYAYWPAGTVDWDDVVVKQIVPPPDR